MKPLSSDLDSAILQMFQHFIPSRNPDPHARPAHPPARHRPRYPCRRGAGRRGQPDHSVACSARRTGRGARVGGAGAGGRCQAGLCARPGGARPGLAPQHARGGADSHALERAVRHPAGSRADLHAPRRLPDADRRDPLRPRRGRAAAARAADAPPGRPAGHRLRPHRGHARAHGPQRRALRAPDGKQRGRRRLQRGFLPA